MAKVGAKRAAELAGKSKSTIQRAMKTGKLSYDVDESGRRLIDVSELERVYGTAQADKAKKETGVTEKTSGVSAAEIELMKARHTLEIERLNMQNKMLQEQVSQSSDTISDLKAQRDQWQKQAQQILLTSQHSQKQSDERIAEMREREESRIRRTMQQRQKVEAEKMKKLHADNENKKPAGNSTVKPGILSRFFGSSKKKSA